MCEILRDISFLSLDEIVLKKNHVEYEDRQPV